MQTYVRGLVPEDTRAAIADAKPGTPIRFVASTEGIARDKLTIAQDGWSLKNFRANPVFLWHHDYMGQRPPIGRVDRVAVEDGKLIADVSFDQGDEFARDIERRYRQNWLSACSVGWDTIEFEPTDKNDPYFGGGKVLKAELLDISAVVVPGDPKALMERQKRALVDFGRDLLKQLEPESPDPLDDPTKTVKTPDPKPDQSARPTRDESMRQMVQLLQPFGQRPDEERRTEYQRLCREYARHTIVPPEFRSTKDLDALGAPEIRGLFLAGEPELFPDVFAALETRAGAVLSRKNRDDLDQAIGLIQGVLARAQKETDDTQTDEERAAGEAVGAIATLLGVKAA